MKIKFIRRGYRACPGDRPGFAESKNSVSSAVSPAPFVWLCEDKSQNALPYHQSSCQKVRGESALKYTNYEAKA